MFLEHWNRHKNILDIRQRFSCLLDERIEKKCNFFFFSRWLFFKIHFIRFEMHMDGRINLKIFLGYDINYLSIWPFMRHPWFPTRKASKLTFICFQLHLFSTLQGLNKWSWKQVNVSFEAFLVGNQGWCIKGQMLRKFIWYPKSIFRFIRPSMCISKRIKWIKKKATVKFIAYFNALETTCALHSSLFSHIKDC